MNNKNKRQGSLSLKRGKALRNISRKAILNKLKSNNSSKQLSVTKTAVPVNMSYSIKNNTNPIISSSNGTFSVRHQEMIFNVITRSVSSGPNGYVVMAINFNPGLKDVFSYLSGIALNYTSYCFNKLVVSYVPSCPTNTIGQIYLAADSDPTSEPPQSDKDMTNHEECIKGSVFLAKDFKPKTSLFQSRKEFFIRFPSQQLPSDLKFYDCMKMYVAYKGTPAQTSIGDIYVSYDITFKTAKIDRSLRQISGIETFGFKTSGTTSNTVPFGSAITSAAQMVGTFLNAGLNVLTGGVSGLFFETAKNCLKVINMTFSADSSGNLPVDVVPRMYQNTSSSISDSALGYGITTYDLEEDNMLYEVANGINTSNYTDVTSAYVATLVNTTGAGNSRIKQYLVKWPAGYVLGFTPSGSGNGTTLGGFISTDADVAVVSQIVGSFSWNDFF